MRNTTLCLLTRGDPPRRILLGLKKHGFGAGKYTGFGGKVEPGETVKQAARREMQEETGVRLTLSDLQLVARLIFVFPFQPDWSQRVHVYRALSWSGTPQESAEMRPAWFGVNTLPLACMWQDAAHWLPPLLHGQHLIARFVFSKDNESLDSIHLRKYFNGQTAA
jgi:8-oxo-dGTP diphosphatase